VNALRARLRADGGFTLVELVVASGILAIILLAVGGLMFSTTMTQRTVSAVNDASSSAQTVADGLRTELRNAAEFRVTTVDTHDRLLVARIAGTGTSTTYTCRAWYFARDEQQVRSRSWPVAGSTALPTTPAAVETWALLLDGVTPHAPSTDVFGTPTGGKVEIAFEVASDDRNEPTAIRFTAVGGQAGGITCWD
jgi:prepilin-type N-terminal cleavage/methylation domain-containing protein